MSDARYFLRITLGGAALLLLASGCAGLHPVNENPAPRVGVAEDGDQYRNLKPPGKSVWKEDAGWWTSFEDRSLDRLVDRALTNNLDLQAVAARIDQAGALARQAGADLFPQLEGGGRFESRWREEGRSEFTTVGALLTWEVDVWGRIRSRRKARLFERDAFVEDWRGARLLLSSAVALVYFEMLEQKQQLDLIEEQIEVNEKLLALARNRFGQAQASIVDVLQQKQQLELTQALAPGVESRLEQLNLALDVLLGGAPGQRKRESLRGTPEPPALPAAGAPSDLLVHRPDLRAIQNRIVAFDHEVGEAIADRLPRFGIDGSLGAGDPSMDVLVGDLAAGLVGPVFEAGKRKAEVDLRSARLVEAVNEYSHTFLVAIQEAETAMVQERKQAEQIALQEKQLATARKLLQETRNRYSQGLTDYLPVLDAVSTVQSLERDLLTSRRELLSFRVTLHRALGGPMPVFPEK